MTGIRFGVEFLARIAHLATFPDDFGKLRTKVSSTLVDKAADFLAFVLKPVGNLFDKFQPTESVQANDLLLPPAEAQSPSGKTVRVYVKKDGIAYISASPERKLKDFVKEIGDPALSAASQELETNATSVKSQKPAFDAALSSAASAKPGATPSAAPINAQPFVDATAKEEEVADLAAKYACDIDQASATISIPTLDEIKTSARKYRQERSWIKGQRNLGGAVIIRKKDCKELRFEKDFPSTFIVSGGDGHSEDQINQRLTADPNIDSKADTIKILLLFTEQSPCPSCERNSIEELKKKNGGAFDVLFFVLYNKGGAETNNALSAEYGFNT